MLFRNKKEYDINVSYHVKTGLNFIYIMVNETSQTLKTTYHIITLIQTSRKGKTIPREIRQVFTWD